MSFFKDFWDDLKSIFDEKGVPRSRFPSSKAPMPPVAPRPPRPPRVPSMNMHFGSNSEISINGMNIQVKGSRLYVNGQEYVPAGTSGGSPPPEENVLEDLDGGSKRATISQDTVIESVTGDLYVQVMGGQVHLEIKGNVGGCVEAEGNVTVHQGVGEYVDAAGSITVNGNVTTYADAGGALTAHDIGRYAQAGGGISARDIGGNVEAGGSVTAERILGNVDAGGSVNCHRRG